MTHSIPHQNPIPHFEDEHINITIDSDESKSFIHYIETELLDDESIEPSKELINYLDNIFNIDTGTQFHFSNEFTSLKRTKGTSRKSIYTLDNPIWNPDRVSKYLEYRSDYKMTQDYLDQPTSPHQINSFFINWREQISLQLWIWDKGRLPGQKECIQDKFLSRDDYLEYLFEKRINSLENFSYKEIYEL